MAQYFSSANTSINSSKLPAVYNKVNFSAVATCFGLGVFDYGCGKYTSHIEDFLDEQFGGDFYGYDKFNQDEHINRAAKQAIADHWCDCVVCSNVLNVIMEECIIGDIVNEIVASGLLYFVTVYEGDRSGTGRATKEDCYQRNEKIAEYLKYFPADAVVKHGVITNAPWAVK